MNSLILAELFKALGTLVTTLTAVYAVLTDKLEKVEDGKLTSKGKILIGIALIGMCATIGAQIAQYFAALESAESMRKKSEQAANRLDEVSSNVKTESLAATPLRRFTYVAYFEPTTKPEQFAGDTYSANITFMRGGQSEFRIEVNSLNSSNVSGRIQLEGRDQRVATPLEEGATYAGIFPNFKWQSYESTSVWVDLGLNNLIRSLESSHDGHFDYWPYRTVADLKDVWIMIDVKGKLGDHQAVSFLRFNENLVVQFPPLSNGRAEIRKVLDAIKRDSSNEEDKQPGP